MDIERGPPDLGVAAPGVSCGWRKLVVPKLVMRDFEAARETVLVEGGHTIREPMGGEEGRISARLDANVQ